MKFGIIGFGRFGKLWAKSLLPYGEVSVYDKLQMNSNSAEIQFTSFEEVLKVDVLFLLVPISEFEKCCQEIYPHLALDTLVIECCSVKVHSISVMKRYFKADQPCLATHPLFGPDSYKRKGGLKGQKIVICENTNMSDKENIIQKMFIEMGLIILVTTALEHDKQMANSQSLVHFIGRGLKALNLHPQDIATPDFEALLNINNMVLHDTRQLFLDMQRYNPYTKTMRQKFIHQLSLLNNEIDVEKINANP